MDRTRVEQNLTSPVLPASASRRANPCLLKCRQQDLSSKTVHATATSFPDDDLQKNERCKEDREQPRGIPNDAASHSSAAVLRPGN
jgi:hypothetical protein